MRTKFFAACIAVWLSSPAASQPLIAAKAGLISYFDGDVYVNGRRVQSGPTKWTQLEDNDVLRTGAGRVEVLLNSCAVLHLDNNSVLRMWSTRLVATRVEVFAGSALVHNQVQPKNTQLTLVSGRGTTVLNRRGVFRFDAEPARLRVFSGSTAIRIGGRDVVARSGNVVALGDTPNVAKFDVKSADEFDYWSRVRMTDLAKSSGLTANEARQREEIADSRRRADKIAAQTQNPNSIYYDPLGPAPAPRIEPITQPMAGSQLCSPSGR